MKEQYSVNEILEAIDDLQSLKKEKKINTIEIDKSISKKNSDIPINTLRLIEEAENSVK